MHTHTTWSEASLPSEQQFNVCPSPLPLDRLMSSAEFMSQYAPLSRPTSWQVWLPQSWLMKNMQL
eukprot:5275701-Amphidinium_carterae.2